MPTDTLERRLLLRQRDQAEPAHPKVRGAAREHALNRSDRGILCAACRYRVTADGHRIAVSGGHDHRCVNPHGIQFHIGCFRQAPGCVTLGEPTTEFTWFPGFAWSQALCKGCSQHLGWRFESAEASVFFGLVLDRLIVRANGMG